MAPTRVELDIPIAADEMVAAEERAFRKIVRNVRMPGFRRGKVPRKVFEQTYGSSAIRQEAIEDVIPTAYARAIRDHDLEPIERPKVEIVEEADGRPIRIKASVEVRPEIMLQRYTGVAVSLPASVVGDDDVERAVDALAKERATLVPVDRPAQLGDVVTLDYLGTIDGVAFDGGSATGESAELSEGRFIPGFADGIVGMQSGESKDVVAHFPPEYAQSDLAGKDAVFAVTVHDVKAYEMPAIDDAFAATVSPDATLDGLRADVRRRLEAVTELRDRRTIANAVLDTLLREHDFALPESMIETEIDHAIDDLTAAAARSGETFEAYLTRVGKTESDLRDFYRPQAQTRVKTTLLVEHIAKTERIVATPADVSAELEALARQYRQRPEAVRRALGDNVLPLMAGIARNKTLEFLVDHAEVTRQ